MMDHRIGRLLAGLLLLAGLAACNDPATTFASGLRSWCHSASNCTDQERN